MSYLKRLDYYKDYYLKNKNRLAEYRKTEKVRKSEAMRHKRDKAIYRARLLKIKKDFGGKCKLCGYRDEIRILQFHHLRDKEFELCQYHKSEKRMRAEAEKCILICPNCHALEHLKQ